MKSSVQINFPKLQAMIKSGKEKFLIDGFPRNKNNLDGWNRMMGEKTQLQFVLFFDCDEQVCAIIAQPITDSSRLCTPKTLLPGFEPQILGVKISTLFIYMWHAHCKRIDTALRKHNTLV